MGTDNLDEPLERAVRDGRRVFVRLTQAVVDRAREWLSAALFGLVIAALGSAAFVGASLPWIAATVLGVSVVGLVVALLYGYRLLLEERGMRRHAFIAGKRREQDVLRREQALDDATLALVGDSRNRGVRASVLSRHRELGQAVRYLGHRSRAAAPQGRPQSASARARRPAAPAEPDVERVRRRRTRRDAEIAALEAEVQALAVPEEASRRQQAREARREAREISAATRRADRLARERSRRGLRPTRPEGEETLQLSISPTGARDVRRAAAAPTPESLVSAATERARQP